ncbi:MAG: nucleoside deaminase [Synergistaceae bacterium]|nr:nucleoside deaminase [Synergistaceae bacterium]
MRDVVGDAESGIPQLRDAMINHDIEFMSVAVSYAIEASKRGDVPVGAVIVQRIKGQESINNRIIISADGNKKSIDPTAHAEMNVIRNACQILDRWNLSDCELYVTLEPCPMCAGAIVLSRISRVVFGCVDPKAGAAGTLYNILNDSRLNHRCRITGGILAGESRALLVDFFKERRERK